MLRFGHAMLAEWAFEPGLLYLNHGTVGAVPRRVTAAQNAIRDAIEAQPSRFLLRELSVIASRPWPVPRLRAAAARVAEFVGARGEDLAFVVNATTGCNAVLRSLELAPGDEIVTTELGYGAVTNAARYVARRQGATVRVARVPLPLPEDRAVIDAIEAEFTPRTRLVVMDHVTSHSALILPVAEIASRARARGIATLVDGAHAPGAIPLDVPALGVDWYAANLHKWAWSPRSAAFLWTTPGRQSETKPVTISWGLDQGYAAEFDWVGTPDPTTYLAAPAGLDWMRELGVERVMRYNHELVWSAAQRLGGRWEGTAAGSEAMVGAMATVALPARLGTTPADAMRLRDTLLERDHIEVELHEGRGRLWVRLSAQIYNEMEDYERLAAAIASYR